MIYSYPFVPQETASFRVDNVVIAGTQVLAEDETAIFSPIFGVSVVDTSRSYSDVTALERAIQVASLLAYNVEFGFRERNPGAIGGYYAMDAHLLDPENQQLAAEWGSQGLAKIREIQNPAVLADIGTFLSIRDPYTLQAGWCLAKSFGLGSNHEVASLQLFKVLELAIKKLASEGLLTHEATEMVKSGKIFGKKMGAVYTSLLNLGLNQELVDWLWELVNLRNSTMGHGVIEPFFNSIYGMTQVFDRPQNILAIRNYSPDLQWNDGFYGQVYQDMKIMAKIVFGFMAGVSPRIVQYPGCWDDPSEAGAKIMKAVQVDRTLWSDFYDEFTNNEHEAKR